MKKTEFLSYFTSFNKYYNHLWQTARYPLSHHLCNIWPILPQIIGVIKIFLLLSTIIILEIIYTSTLEITNKFTIRCIFIRNIGTWRCFPRDWEKQVQKNTLLLVFIIFNYNLRNKQSKLWKGPIFISLVKKVWMVKIPKLLAEYYTIPVISWG